MTDTAMTIGKVAKEVDMTTEAIRFYEREGLLARPARTHTGYRLYGPEIIGRLRFIRKARHLGLSLKEIKEIFAMTRVGHAPCCQVRELLDGKFEDLDRRIRELTQFRAQLKRFISEIAKMPDQADGSRQVCALIEIAPLPESSEETPTRKKTARGGKQRKRSQIKAS